MFRVSTLLLNPTYKKLKFWSFVSPSPVHVSPKYALIMIMSKSYGYDTLWLITTFFSLWGVLWQSLSSKEIGLYNHNGEL